MPSATQAQQAAPAAAGEMSTPDTVVDPKAAENAHLVGAIDWSQAVIQFQLDGTILDANENFLRAMGYTIEEIRGRHHSMFADPEYARSPEYRAFWDRLRAGEAFSGEHRRLGKGGKEVWIQASYTPILDPAGKPLKVVKFATDVTAAKRRSAEDAGWIKAINKSQAVIEFEPDGTIITANERFLAAVGYRLDEIRGKHHRMFVDPDEAAGTAYAEFWARLGRGEFDARVYRRFAKGGRPFWIQATYNPIIDATGKPFKIVKFATDVSRIIETAAIAETVTINVHSVAEAVEEMSASVAEISRNMVMTKDAAQGILDAARRSSDSADRLVTSARSMEGIVKLINHLAEQVNLLALNATLEAARAGAAGKGFAVVAGEVKNLANQTSKATEQIAREIEGMQAASGTVVEGVKSIHASAEGVNHYVTGVASAVEEQSAVTREISGNTLKVASSVSEITARIKGLTAT